MTKIICGWCGKEINASCSKGVYGYNGISCSECGRQLPASKIEREDGKHFHTTYKDGDVAI